MSSPFDVPGAVAVPSSRPTIGGFVRAVRLFRESAGLASGALLIAGIAIAADAVYPSAEATRPLQPGASVPAVGVRAVDGSTVDVSDLTRDSGALLVFYRGGW